MNHQVTFPTPDSQEPTLLPTPLSDLQDTFRHRFHSGNKRAKLTLADWWHAGAALVQIKAKLPHGAFVAFLADEGVPRTTAHRLMKLANADLASLSDFASITAVLASMKTDQQLPPANVPRGTFEPANDPEPPIATPEPDDAAVEPSPAPPPEPIEADFHEVEPQDFLQDRLSHAEARNSELMEELVELRERLAMLAAHWDDEPLQVLEKISKTHCAEVSELRGDLHSKHQNYEAIKRRLGRIRGTLLERGTCRACNDVLAKEYGTARK